MSTLGEGLLARARGRRRLRRLKRRFPDLRLESAVTLLGDMRNLHIDEGGVLQTGVVLHAGGLDWCRNAGRIEIGAGSCIGQYCVLYGCGPGGISIGERFDCAPGVGIFASRTDFERGPGRHLFAPVEIGSDVTVFANAVISPGVRVGAGAVIAAGAVVTRDVPAGALAGGVPARVIRDNLPNR